MTLLMQQKNIIGGLRVKPAMTVKTLSEVEIAYLENLKAVQKKLGKNYVKKNILSVKSDSIKYKIYKTK